MLKRVIRTERVDKKRVYISGLSMGGFGTFEIVSRFPKLFAAVLPICGGGDAKHYNKKIKTGSFWVFHCAYHAVVNVNYSRETGEKLEVMGGTVRYAAYA